MIFSNSKRVSFGWHDFFPDAHLKKEFASNKTSEAKMLIRHFILNENLHIKEYVDYRSFVNN